MIKINEINSQCVIFLYRKSTSNLAENPATNIVQLVGFGLACAPVRCAHPSFWAHCHAKRAPRPSQLHCFIFIGQKL
jgi:hypothetical protein